MIRIIALAALMFASGISLAQTHQPYAGMQQRQIKALSDEQLADLRAGRGMGLALPAELNGYPGPLHVIQLANELALTKDQRTRIEQLYEKMKSEAVGIGEQLIVREATLDRLFADRRVTQANLAAATAKIGQTQAQLRATHLRYHLLTVAVLTRHQLDQYSQLRGYKGEEPAKNPHSGPHHQRN
jgi:Spy/CpxP family protein refolding chaperone